MEPEVWYDVALSFAGEDRAHAEALASELRQRAIAVFYDEHEKAALWGKDLQQHLSDLYQRRARYCVIFVSKHYAGKDWPRHELKAALARALTDREEYILPVRLDATEVSGLLATTMYLQVPPETPATLADFIEAKLVAKKRFANSQRTLMQPSAAAIAEHPHVAERGANAGSTSPSVSPVPQIQLRYKSGGNSPQWAFIAFQLRNQGTTPVALADVVVRYWFTDPAPASYATQCQYAQGPANCGHLNMTFNQVHGREQANHVFQVAFRAPAGNLVPGSTSEIQVGFHRADWAAIDQAKHYSHGGKGTSGFAEWPLMTVYSKDLLVWGSEPK